MNYIAEDILQHYGMPRRSGRYPYGSGKDSYQHNSDFLGRIDKLKKNGWTETAENIKKEFGMSTTEYRAQKGIAKAERQTLARARAKSLREDGLNNSEIGRRMGVNESTVRGYFNEKSNVNATRARNTADLLKKHVDEKGMIDVGAGVDNELGVSRERMTQALKILDQEGYHSFPCRVPQNTNPGKYTTTKVLCPPGTPYTVKPNGTKVSSAVYDFDKINTIKEYASRDGGLTFDKMVYPKSLDGNRVKVRYAEEGGADRDGLIELRRGVKDISLGNDRYAQVRILVDGDRYLKGMAVYSDDMPDGVDVIFNTNKHVGTSKRDVMKAIKENKYDPNNPFGTTIKPRGQSYYIDENGNRQLSVINKKASEGDWSDWSDALPSQFLSKQQIPLAKKQLNLAIANKQAEYDTIKSLTNPTIRKFYLNKFAEDCDSSAVDLKAAALPGQKYHVIIPINTLKDTEVYAPRYEPGTKLALVRYPHGGIFEIPILTVNNKNPDAKKFLGSLASDAIGINKKVADQLSGADFDGDTVMCIPTHDRYGKVRINSKKPLDGLKGYDPKEAYPEVPGMKVMSEKSKGLYMGKITNLINDMTLGGATDDELAAAVRHSMVVIDAAKHRLNYKQSEIDNNIDALTKRYQLKVDRNGKITYGGASTIISRAKSEEQILKTQGTPKTNIKGKPWYDPSKPEGALIYKVADDVNYSYKKVNKRTGEVTIVEKQRTQTSTKMREADDARDLISLGNWEMERLYADYANKLKAMANDARKEAYFTKKIEYDANAAKVYREEVKSLASKLDIAELNKPIERHAQRKTTVEIQKIIDADPNIAKDELKKIKDNTLRNYRDSMGSVARKNRSIKITDREWEAIQAGAISDNKLTKILNNSDPDILRQKAMPKATSELSPSNVARAKALSASNFTLNEIAKKLGYPTSTIAKYLKGET